MACGKMVFSTRQQGESYIKGIKKSKIPLNGALSVYQCPKCGQYHLTSHTPAKRRHVAKLKKAFKRKMKRNADEKANSES